MALVTCGDCDTNVSDQAAACPRCGAPPSVFRSAWVTKQTAAPDAMPPPPVKRPPHLWPWVIGGALVLFFIAVHTGNTPEATERASANKAVELCWADYERKSLDPATKRFIAGACEKLEKAASKK